MNQELEPKLRRNPDLSILETGTDILRSFLFD